MQLLMLIGAVLFAIGMAGGAARFRRTSAREPLEQSAG